MTALGVRGLFVSFVAPDRAKPFAFGAEKSLDPRFRDGERGW